jgi:hypothetical protein
MELANIHSNNCKKEELFMDKLKIFIPLFILMIGLMPVSSAQSATYTFSPAPSDLNDLDHNSYYTWGTNWSLPSHEKITGATLTYYNIWDWQIETDHLYTHLLNSATAGVVSIWDGEGGGDNFSGQGLLLGDWNDPIGGYPRNFALVYDIDSSYFSWLSDGNFGFGIDPDCHYYNEGIQFKITTTHAPEPSTMLLLGSGLLGLAGYGRKKFFKK